MPGVLKNPYLDDEDDQAESRPLTPEQQYRNKVLESFNNLPWYKQAGTAASDTLGLGTNALTFGALEGLASLDPTGEQQFEDARIRSGMARLPIEVMGMLKSPVTKSISALGNMLRPTGEGILKSLVRGGTYALEGGAQGGLNAALSGNTDEIVTDAETGAVLNAGLRGLGKTLGPAYSYTSGFMSGKDPALLKAAFKAGKDPLTAKAFRAGQKGKDMATPAFVSANTKFLSTEPLKSAYGELKKELITPQGRFMGSNKQAKAFGKVFDLFRGAKSINASEMHAIKTQLEEFATSKDDIISSIGKRMQKAVEKSLSTADESAMKSVKTIDAFKEATRAGRGLSRKLPSGLAAFSASLPASISAAGLAFGLPVAAATSLAIPLASPRLSGLMANIAGRASKYDIPKVGVMSKLARDNYAYKDNTVKDDEYLNPQLDKNNPYR